MLSLRENLFLNGFTSGIPASFDELPETTLGDLLNIIRNYEKSNLDKAPIDENGDIFEDFIESHFNLLDNLYALFIVNLWCLAEHFLTNEKRLFINLQHQRNSEPFEKIDSVKYDEKFKKWVNKNLNLQTSNLKYEKTVDLIRILCNHFKHNGQLNLIIPADFDPFSTEQYINKGIEKLNKDYISSLRNYFTVQKNPSYSDLNIEKMMYDLGAFCIDFHFKIVAKYKSNTGL